MTTPHLSSELVEDCCPVCFIRYAAPKAMFDKRQAEGGSWHCPNGHSISYVKSALTKAKEEAAELRRERDRLVQNEAWYDDQLKAQRKAQQALKRQLKTVHTRVGNGVCPCCNRTFANLQRHMTGKHPDYQAAA